jgi:hypothetical protein
MQRDVHVKISQHLSTQLSGEGGDDDPNDDIGAFYIDGTTQCTFRIVSVSREVGQSFGSGALHVKIVRQLRPLDVNVWHMQLPST